MMSEKYMENSEEKETFDDDLISTETLHDIHDGVLALWQAALCKDAL